MPTPIKITLYDPKTQEPLGEYSQTLVTFEMLVKASQLKESIDASPATGRKWWWMKIETNEERQIGAIMTLVVEFFGNQFTVEQLRTGADVAEVIAVLRAILARASSIIQANPTLPPRKK